MDLLAAVMMFWVLTRPRLAWMEALVARPVGSCTGDPPTIGASCQTPSPTPPA
jgi:hypothetical protein